MKKTKQRLVILAIVLLALLAAGILVVPGLLGDRDREIEKLIERYSTAPDQQTADRLVELVGTGSVPLETGNAILEALTRPTVHTRDSYATGTWPDVSVAYRHTIGLLAVSFQLSVVGPTRSPLGRG